MSFVIVTGSSGLVGSESARRFAQLGHTVIGIDNDMRAYYFGTEASTRWKADELKVELGGRYIHHEIDVRDGKSIDALFRDYGKDVIAVIHTAAQPSHDWAAREPLVDFTVNATGTMNMLEATRNFAPQAVFIFTSTNKVYGDRPNALPLIELENRWEIDPSHQFADGIDESMSIDGTLHSVFGASKVAADVLVQEYGRYFGLQTGIFRGGCLTGPAHVGAQAHGFLAYLMHCAIHRKPYTIFGYKGKQVRDNIHSADLVTAFVEFAEEPRPGEVYNMGGSRHSNCSMLEAISLCEGITGNRMEYRYVDEPRKGDHIWYISSVRKFRQHYPNW
ncbi:MAG: NAD-dependent epimerase/dehydratase family protein, partial [Vulcanimicrobiaceae bacterium]